MNIHSHPWYLKYPGFDLSHDTYFLGGICKKGEFCPKGSSSPTICTAGFYCNQYKLSAVSGICPAGYYCSGGTKDRFPVNKTYGDICPAGSYCLEGSDKPTPCLMGFFAQGAGNRFSNSCVLCMW